MSFALARIPIVTCIRQFIKGRFFLSLIHKGCDVFVKEMDSGISYLQDSLLVSASHYVGDLALKLSCSIRFNAVVDWKLESCDKIEDKVARDVACNHAGGTNDVVENYATGVTMETELRHVSYGLIDDNA